MQALHRQGAVVNGRRAVHMTRTVQPQKDACREWLRLTFQRQRFAYMDNTTSTRQRVLLSGMPRAHERADPGGAFRGKSSNN